MVLRKRMRRTRQAKGAKRKGGRSPKYYRVVRAIAALKNTNGSSLKSIQRQMGTSRKVTVSMMKRAMRARLVIRSRGRFKVSRLGRRSRRGRRRRSRRRRRRGAGKKRRRRGRRGRRTRRRRKRSVSRRRKGRRGRRQRRRRRKVSRRRGRKSRRKMYKRRARRAPLKVNSLNHKTA